MLQKLFRLFPLLWGHWLAIVGTVVTTITANAFMVFFVMDVVRGLNTYSSAVAYLILPFFFIGGLALIALGVWRGSKRVKDEADKTALSKAVESIVADKRARRRVTIFASLTLVNVAIVTVATYKGVSYTGSPGFCGALCHEVMEPEHKVYLRSAHARVTCAGCHVGSGIGPFFSSKLAGARQLWHVITGDIPRPIKVPVHGLRPARDTCEHCHWPAKFTGDRMIVRHRYKEDEKNTRVTNVVQLHIGGHSSRTGAHEGIHWHISNKVKITYEALDEKRSIIGRVFVERDGKKLTFYPPKQYTDPKTKKKVPYPTKVVETRVMDCVDCHNRPTHVYAANAASAVDRAITLGKIDVTLPFIKKVATSLLNESVTAPRDGAAKRYIGKLQAHYAKANPQVAKDKAKAIEAAGKALGKLYVDNIWPRMKIGWGTYPSHLGHRTTTEGCFRCHDDEHATKPEGKDAKKKVIGQDCDTCHDVLADGEEKPSVPKSVLKLGERY